MSHYGDAAEFRLTARGPRYQRTALMNKICALKPGEDSDCWGCQSVKQLAYAREGVSRRDKGRTFRQCGAGGLAFRRLRAKGAIAD